MKFFREHRGITAALILSSAVIVAAIVVVTETPIRVEPVSASPTNDIAESVAETDSDGDGLFDWEEELWGTDPRKVDTDGDGVLDGDQVRARAQAQLDDGDLGLPASAPETYTESFAREFFGSYLELRSAGIDPTTQSAIGELFRTLPVYLTPKVGQGVTRAELTITENTPEAFRTYFANLEEIILTPTPEGLEEGELVIFERALRLEDEGELEKLLRISESYSATEKMLVVLPVPDALVSEHRKLIRGVQTIGLQIAQFAEAYKDPIATIAALEAYQSGAGQMGESFVGLVDTAKDFGFELGPQDKGYATFNILYDTQVE